MNPNIKQATPQPQINQAPAAPVAPAPTSAPSAPKPPEIKSKIKSLMLLEIGLLEIGFVVLILVIFFGVLNYFNVLSLSSLYPNQLGWLPHITKSVNVSNNSTNPSFPPQSPTPTPYSLNAAKKALAGKQLENEATDAQIASYMNKMQQEYPIPTPISKNSSENQNTSGILSGFGSNYFQVVGNGAIVTNFFYDESTSFTSSATASAEVPLGPNDVLFSPSNPADFLNSKNFGNNVQIEYTATISSYLKAVFASF